MFVTLQKCNSSAHYFLETEKMLYCTQWLSRLQLNNQFFGGHQWTGGSKSFKCSKNIYLSHVKYKIRWKVIKIYYKALTFWNTAIKKLEKEEKGLKKLWNFEFAIRKNPEKKSLFSHILFEKANYLGKKCRLVFDLMLLDLKSLWSCLKICTCTRDWALSSV